MRRAVNVWRLVVLLLLLSAVISTYLLLAATWRQTQVRSASLDPSGSNPHPAVQLLLPRPESVYRLGDPVPVEVMVTAAGYRQVDLLIDGLAAETSTNADPDLVPWLVEFSWLGSNEGVYVLGAQARDAEGEWDISAAVTVTVVPTGYLFFASNRDGAYAIYRMTADGRDLLRLTAGPGHARQPCVLPDGTLVYAADSGEGRSVIYLALAQGEPAPIVAGTDPACPLDGGRLAGVAGVGGTNQVLTVYPWGGVPQVVTAEAAEAGQPAWSPDASHIAYVANRDGNWDIWVVSSVGGEARRLTDDPAIDWAPAWSPDGTRLAFVSNREGRHQVYTMWADGSRITRVTELPGGAESPAWSPDGYWLTFVGYGGFGAGVNGREIYVVRADGRYPVRLTYNRNDDTDVTWAVVP